MHFFIFQVVNKGESLPAMKKMALLLKSHVRVKSMAMKVLGFDEWAKLCKDVWRGDTRAADAFVQSHAPSFMKTRAVSKLPALFSSAMDSIRQKLAQEPSTLVGTAQRLGVSSSTVVTEGAPSFLLPASACPLCALFSPFVPKRASLFTHPSACCSCR
jgi:hypothetical protein